MWSWVATAVSKATDVVKKGVTAVKNAASIIDSVEKVAAVKTSEVVSKVSAVGTAVKKDWKEAYNRATDQFIGG